MSWQKAEFALDRLNKNVSVVLTLAHHTCFLHAE